MDQIMEVVLEQIPKRQADAVTSRTLMGLTGLSFRRLKQVITELRKEYPICAKETDGGGYWIAENEQDIRDFVAMIAARQRGYMDTITTMQRHLHKEQPKKNKPRNNRPDNNNPLF